jgi:hypothetical protein
MKPRRPTIKDSTQQLRSEGAKRKARQVAARAARKAAAKKAKMAKVGFPTVGDIVVSQDHTGTFKVLSVSNTGSTELQPFLVAKQQVFGSVMKSIPRSRLKPFKEDASQAAARIVREATEDR